jgi:hypothetical protein
MRFYEYNAKVHSKDLNLTLTYIPKSSLLHKSIIMLKE